jgi:hypothetical protein
VAIGARHGTATGERLWNAPPKPNPAGREEARVQVAVDRAMDAFLGANCWWRGSLVPRTMAQDWSWSRSAVYYLNLYRSAL